MRKFAALGILASALVLSATPGIAKNNQITKEARDARVIIEFKQNAQELSNAQLRIYQNQALDIIRNNITDNFGVVSRYTNVLNGVVINVPSSKVNAIRNLDFVSKLDYDTFHHVEGQGDGGIVIRKANDSAVIDDNISAQTMNVPANSKKGEGILIGILDSGFLLNHTAEDGKVYTHETFSALDSSIKTKISSAEETNAIVAKDGFHGKAETVDSLYFNSKVPYFYDYGGASYNRDDYGKVFVPDNDVFSPISDHGLHVASMAAGNGPTYKGIAENAQLALFKVFTEYYPTDKEAKDGYTKSTGCFDTAVLNALEDASLLDCDVLNMSFGSDLNDFDTDTIVHSTLDRLQKEGIWSNYSAGNSGKGYYDGTAYGGWTSDMLETGILGGTANVDAVMTIAANQADRQYYDQAISINDKYITYTDQVISNSSTTYDPDRHFTDFAKPGREIEWVKVPGFGKSADYKDINVKNKLAVIDRGDNTFAEKVELASKAGASAAAIINNSSETVRMSFGDDVTPMIPVILIAYEDRDNFNDGSGKLKVIENVYVDNLTARQMASFSSDGATYDYRIKPEISAPGHLVKGAVSENEAGEVIDTATNTYDYWSGTSMSAPNYTGAVALLLGEHTVEKNGKLDVDPDYVSSVNARAMSTADQMVDKYGLDASVRIQGAGMVNVGNALQSDIYLEQTTGISKAKIELFNNEDIAKGDIKLSFNAVNEGKEVKFDATIKVYRPTVYCYDRHEKSKESASLNGVKLQAITNSLIREVKTTVTIPEGKSVITLDTISLTEDEKAFIEQNFEAACPIEGYVVLTNAQNPKLSIPFLGFYGDVKNAPCVEPFNFEKVEGKTYQSQITNGILEIMGFNDGDFSSDMVYGYFDKSFFDEDDEDDDEESPLTDWLYNKASLTDIKGSNKATFNQINTLENSDGSHTIFVNNNARSNTIIIQQYIMRSISYNDLTITKKSDNSVVLNDHMFDTFWGDSGDEEKGEEPNYSLAKSFCIDDYLSNGIIGHRAYSIIALFNQETEVDYAEGEYELKFDYTLTDGTHQTLSYDLVISNNVPNVAYVLDGGNFVRVRFEGGIDMNYVTLAGKTIVGVKHDELGYYVDIAKTDFKNGKILATGTSILRNNTTVIAQDNGTDNIAISNLGLTASHKFTVDKSVADNILSYKLTYLNNNKEVVIQGDVYVSLTIPEGYSVKDTKIFDYNKNGERVATEFTNNGRNIRFLTKKGQFDIELGSAITLSKFEVSAPNKTLYAVNDKLDLTGAVAIATYSDGTKSEVVDYEVSAVNMATAGEKTVTFTYQGKTASFKIDVVNKTAISAEITTLPSRLEYTVGEELDISGIKVTVNYNDGTSAIIENATAGEVDMSSTGSKEVNINVSGFELSFNITVLKSGVEKIEITQNPNKSSFAVGEKLDTTGIVVVATFEDGTTAEITNFSVLNFDNSKEGEKVVTIAYGGKTATFTVNITAPARKGGCGGSIAATSILLSTTAVLGATLLLLKKRKEK